MPFSTKRIKVSLPKPIDYPKALITIGDHIRAWRIDNHLPQSDVARMLQVSVDSIIGWEIRGTIPTIRQMPRIIKILGYMPIQLDMQSLANQITFYRYTHGLTPKEFGALVSVDASTVRDWEKGKHSPPRTKREKIDAILIY